MVPRFTTTHRSWQKCSAPASVDTLGADQCRASLDTLRRAVAATVHTHHAPPDQSGSPDGRPIDAYDRHAEGASCRATEISVPSPPSTMARPHCSPISAALQPANGTADFIGTAPLHHRVVAAVSQKIGVESTQLPSSWLISRVPSRCDGHAAIATEHGARGGGHARI